MSTTAVQEAENLEIEQVEARINADRNLNKNRRYVGTKETLAYIIYDISASFNISKYNDVFITDIVQIGLRFQTIVINNDEIISAIQKNDFRKDRIPAFREKFMGACDGRSTARIAKYAIM